VPARTLRSSGGPQLTRRKVDRNPVVDDAGLDAIVHIPKGCRQRHDTVAEKWYTVVVSVVRLQPRRLACAVAFALSPLSATPS
jgi:hypothetical protein